MFTLNIQNCQMKKSYNYCHVFCILTNYITLTRLSLTDNRILSDCSIDTCMQASLKQYPLWKAYTLTWTEFTGDDFKQQHQFEAIPEVFLYDLNLCPSFPQVRVTPGRERLGNKYYTHQHTVSSPTSHTHHVYVLPIISTAFESYTQLSSNAESLHKTWLS